MCSGYEKWRLPGEHRLADERVRPDYAIHVGQVLVGYVELKAPGRGVDPSHFRGHDRQQWERLACLPNVLYSDGQSFALFRDGEQTGPAITLQGDVRSAGEAVTCDKDALLGLFETFLSWAPIPPRHPRELATVAARLCRLLRTEVVEALASDTGLRHLAEDWRSFLFPEATDAEFADRYAQTVTFALLLARVENIDLAERRLDDVATDLGQRHTLMGRALDVLTDHRVLSSLAVSITTLQRVLAVVDWQHLTRRNPSAWLYFYEDFLDAYDPVLRRATGSYYTPIEAVDPMIRLVEELLIQRLGQVQGFAAPGVTVVDPGAGTGTYLFRVIERIAATVTASEGPGAVGPRLRLAVKRLIGFELQTGPYSVAELRLSAELDRHQANLQAGELRLYLADTLANPYQAEQHLPAFLAPIAASRTAANKVKIDEPVMVVIGNPPYRERSAGRGGWIESGHPQAGQSAPLEAFVPPRHWGVGAHVKHLYNPYVYFWRWATWKVFEGHPTDRGVVAFISVAGFINGPGFAGMRAYLRRTCDAVWVIDCSPEGHQPEVPTRIFQGVQQPVCIAIAMRNGATAPDKPATVRYTSIAGRREEKFAALADLHLDGAGWADCPPDWGAPFLPTGDVEWRAFPTIDDLVGWSGSGTMPGRTWVVAPSPQPLRDRWRRLVEAPALEKPALLREHPRDRRVDTVLSDNLPGYPTPAGPLATETNNDIFPQRYGFRSFDRAWIIPDKRVINQPNPGLWRVRNAPGQIYLTGLRAHAPSTGPALTATALVPDLDHHRGSFGGRAWPLWLDSAGTVPNVIPGLLDHLSTLYATPIGGPDIFAYLAGLLAHPGYTTRFLADLLTPGLRVPLSADARLFMEAVDLGRRVLWLHTFGDRFIDAADGRPAGPPRLSPPRRPAVTQAIPDTEAAMPETIAYNPASALLSVGEGRITPVEPTAWTYEISGMRVVKRWFDRRKKRPEGRRSSPLDDLVAGTWSPEWTTELLELLNVLTLLADLEPAQAALLEQIADGPLVSVTDLTDARLLPGTARPQPERDSNRLPLG